MTANLGEDDHFSLVRQGSVHLMLKFRPALQAAMTVIVIVYTQFKDVIEVVRDRNVILTLEYEIGRDRACTETESHWRLCC